MICSLLLCWISTRSLTAICTHALLLAFLCYSTLEVPAQYLCTCIPASGQRGAREAARQCNARTLMILLNKTRRQPVSDMQVAFCGYNADSGMHTGGTMWLGTCDDYPCIILEGRQFSCHVYSHECWDIVVNRWTVLLRAMAPYMLIKKEGVARHAQARMQIFRQ